MEGELFAVGRRKIRWEPEEAPPSSPIVTVDVQQSFIQQPSGTTLVVQEDGRRTYKKRTGNGHTSEKVRDLENFERGMIRDHLFIPKNGQIEDDDCVIFKNNVSEMNEIAIFQITGFISVLHTQVAEGRLMVNDLVAYELWMRTKYGRLWARYNLPIYATARAVNAQAIATGQTPTARARRQLPRVATAIREPVTTDSTASRIASSVSSMFSGTGPVNLTPAFTTFAKRKAGAA